MRKELEIDAMWIYIVLLIIGDIAMAIWTGAL